MKINKYLATVVFHFDGMLHASQYDTRKWQSSVPVKAYFSLLPQKW